MTALNVDVTGLNREQIAAVEARLGAITPKTRQGFAAQPREIQQELIQGLVRDCLARMPATLVPESGMSAEQSVASPDQVVVVAPAPPVPRALAERVRAPIPLDRGLAGSSGYSRRNPYVPTPDVRQPPALTVDGMLAITAFEAKYRAGFDRNIKETQRAIRDDRRLDRIARELAMPVRAPVAMRPAPKPAGKPPTGRLTLAPQRSSAAIAIPSITEGARARASAFQPPVRRAPGSDTAL
jgi:hypothetical protein